jgi:hypothetical protein
LGGSDLQAIREAIVEVSRYVSRGAQ